MGVGIAVTLVLAQDGLLIANGRDGTSTVLEWWSPRWELWTLAPSFIFHEAPTALAHSVLWLAVAGLAAAALRRSRAAIAGAAALTAFAVFVAALGIVAAIMPMLPHDPPMPRVNLQARSRLAALDRFDVQALPAAIVYDPLRKTNAGALLSPDSLARAHAQGLDARKYLAANDSYGIFSALGDLVVTGPTRTNVNDYRAILIT